MREFAKVMAILVFCGSAVAAAVAWADDHPSPATLYCRIGCSIGAVAAVAAFLALHFRRDLAPDFLSRYCRSYFDRNGFCFACSVSAEKGIGFFNVLFQNRHERACTAQIAIRAVKGAIQQTESRLLDVLFEAAHVNVIDGVFSRKEGVLTIQMDCGPGAFGVASFPLGVPVRWQGKRRKFDVGASVNYPNGKGRTLRFRDGLTIRHNAEFRSRFGRMLTWAGAVAGSIVWTSPACFTVTLPSGVAESVPPDIQPGIRVLWTLGKDPWTDLGVLTFGTAGGEANGLAEDEA